ncbi:hypothetical protein E3T31_09290 [Cryobacterium sp. TMS1-13-1]|nr:hypothetical protein E3T31_09290 [Cryobacterium sp. TMS1-13-1]
MGSVSHAVFQLPFQSLFHGSLIGSAGGSGAGGSGGGGAGGSGGAAAGGAACCRVGLMRVAGSVA